MVSRYSLLLLVEPAAGEDDDVTKGMVGYVTLVVNTTHLSRPLNYIEPASPYERKWIVNHGELAGYEGVEEGAHRRCEMVFRGLWIP